MNDSSFPASANSPTLATLSKSLGVSISTVSRALKDHPSISELTRMKVREEAQRQGYAPNPYISALMHSLKARRPVPYRATIAVLDTLDTPDSWKLFNVQRQFQAGVETRAGELGYKIERHWSEAGRSPASLTRILISRGIRGVLIPPVLQVGENARLIPVDHTQFSCVTIGTRMSDPAMYFCTNDQLATGQMALENLVRLGYKRIGMAIPDYVEKMVGLRFGLGFRGAAEMLGLRLPAKALLRYPNIGLGGRGAFQRWLVDYRPDAICGTSSDLREWSANAGFQVPGDVTIALLDMGEEHKEWAGIRQNNFLVGTSSVDLLVQRLYQNELGAPDHTYGIIVEGEWIDGSTAPSVSG